MVSLGGSEIYSNQAMLKVITKTWSRDSHGLFDYEATSTKNYVIFTAGRCKIVRRKNDVKQCNESAELDLEERELCRTRAEESKIFFRLILN
jgi:hypothetical protein